MESEPELTPSATRPVARPRSRQGSILERTDATSDRIASPCALSFAGPMPGRLSRSCSDCGSEDAMASSVRSWRITYGGTPRRRACSIRQARSASLTPAADHARVNGTSARRGRWADGTPGREDRLGCKRFRGPAARPGRPGALRRPTPPAAPGARSSARPSITSRPERRETERSVLIVRHADQAGAARRVDPVLDRPRPLSAQGAGRGQLRQRLRQALDARPTSIATILRRP